MRVASWEGRGGDRPTPCDSYEDGRLEVSKKTVTKMATPQGPIPVTDDTFEALGEGRGDTMGG